MSSTYKTPYLGLNKFVGSDKPKMDDFNFDNTQLDNKIKEHIQSIGHITAQERTKWDATNYVVGSYVGDNTSPRSIDIGFNAKFGIIFTIAQPPMQFMTSASQNNQYSGYFSSYGCSAGVKSKENGFQVLQFNNSAPDGKRPLLNMSGYTYVYVAFA